MKKVVSHYIEKVFNVDTPDGSKNFVETKKVDSRDPLMVEKEKELIVFRFYNIDENGDKVNYSGMYYFGERVTIKDLTLINDDFIKKMQRDYLGRRRIDEAIFCENANRIICYINPEDKTIDEVKIERITELARTIFINQREFLNRIIDLLEKYGNDVDIVTLDRYSSIADVITGEQEIDDMHSIIRTYDLYVNEYKVLSSNAIVGKKGMGLDDIDTYIRLSDAIDLVKSLYQEYPYLEGMIKDIMIELWNNEAKEVSISKNKTKHK